MNGVRRLLGGGGGGAAQPEPPPSTLTDPMPVVVTSGKATWVPQVLPSEAPVQSYTDSPKQTTAALFLKKDRQKQQPPIPPSDNDSMPNTSPRSSAASLMSPTRTRSTLATSPSPPSASPLSKSRTIPRKSVNPVGPDIKRSSGLLNTRDELILSLLASEAIVDCRDFEILSAEEVEDLKKEQQILVSRLGAQEKKLSLETKIRDAAVSLSKVNASHKKVSKKTEEQLEAANQRVESAQREYWRLSERANDVSKKLLEHRAGVLSFSVRNMEKRSRDSISGRDSGYTTPGNGAPISPTSSTAASAYSPSRFDGAHLFAGHADTIIPKRRQSPSLTANEIASLEEKLKAATDALHVASKKQAEMTRELSLLQLEKQEVETMMGMELQSAEETINALEKEIPRFEELDAELQSLKDEKGSWERSRQDLERKLEDAQVSGNGAAQAALEEAREEAQRRIGQKEAEMEQLRQRYESEKAEWDEERRQMEDEKLDDLARLQNEMDALRDEDDEALRKAHDELDGVEGQLRSIMQIHGLVSRDSSLRGLVFTISSHLDSMVTKVQGFSTAQAEWESTRKKLEEDVRNGLDKREALVRELEDARREREQARKESRILEDRIRDQPSRNSSMSQGPMSPTMARLPPLPTLPIAPVDPTDANQIVSVLQPIWAVLPSPEFRAARAEKQRSFRAGSPSQPSSPRVGATSLADLDVRSLKALYDGARSPMVSMNTTTFTVEGFAARVQALIADDRALIERLIRFAQAHDMLKKNAERAQKLAQESNAALETYQKQVRSLEERNMDLSGRHAAMQEEVQNLQDAVDRISAEKLEVETLAAEQAETCRQLSEANNTLSARALSLAEEAASAPEMVKKQLEAQLSECRSSLKAAQEEVDAMRMAEQTQQMALLDELNSMQTENSNLKTQLRALKK